MGKLGDYITIKHGFAFKGTAISKEDNGIVLVTPGNFKIGGGFQQDKCKFFHGDYSEEYVLHENDLIVTMTDLSKDGDTLGYSAKVPPSSHRTYLHNQRIGLVRFQNESVDKDFLYWYMRTAYYHQTVLTTASGTTVKHTSPSRICEIEVNFPDISIQKNIGAILNSIDNKIALNMRINDNLLQQAQTLFQAWFVDFVPFGYRMPPNWKKAALGSVARISTETFSPAKNPGIEVEHYSIPALDENRFPVFETAANIKSNKYRLKKRSVLISKLNPNIKRIWRPYCLSNFPVCSTEFIVYEPFNPSYRDFVYSIIDSDRFSVYLCAHTTGSTNSRQRATPSATLDFDIVYPEDSVIHEFCAVVTPLYDMIESNLLQIQSLTKARNELLPRLMSGALDLSGLDL